MAQNIERRTAVWLGADPPATLVRLMEDRQLLLVVGDLAAVREKAPRAVILPFSGDTPGVFSRVVLPVLGTGALFVVITAEQHWDFTARILKNFAGDDSETAARIFRPTDLVQVAEACARHEPGPAPNDALIIEGTLPETPERDLLFRRAFADFERITLCSLDGGKSGASLRRVDATRRGGIAAQPFVTKIGRGKD